MCLLPFWIATILRVAEFFHPDTLPAWSVARTRNTRVLLNG